MSLVKSKQRVADHGEVFTPDWLVEEMLDLVKDETERIDSRFLEPACGSGNFVVRILQRKLAAVELKYAQSQFEKRQYALLALMCTYGIELLADNIGECRANMLKVFADYLWIDSSDELYGAASFVLTQNFVHGDALTMRTSGGNPITFAEWAYIGKGRFQRRGFQFDVVIGNPPYQLADGGFGTSASPIYQLFVEKALDLAPRYAIFVTPSRWMAGGKGLGKYRLRMLSDKRLRNIVDYPELYGVFHGVKIRGGVSYFLWDREYQGPCTVQAMWGETPLGPAVARYLDDFDVLVRRNEAVPILKKVRAKGEPTLDARVSSRKPFGLPTNFRGKPSKSGLKHPIQLFENRGVGYVELKDVRINAEWVKEWKVLMTAVQGTSAAVETKFLSKPIVAGPGTACTETYLVAGHFHSEKEAVNYATYLRTRFLRFLVSLRKGTQHATRDVYAFAPDLPRNEEWTDAKLYMKYGFTDQEVRFLESQVAAHDETVVSKDEVAGEDA